MFMKHFMLLLYCAACHTMLCTKQRTLNTFFFLSPANKIHSTSVDIFLYSKILFLDFLWICHHFFFAGQTPRSARRCTKGESSFKSFLEDKRRVACRVWLTWLNTGFIQSQMLWFFVLGCLLWPPHLCFCTRSQPADWKYEEIRI